MKRHKLNRSMVQGPLLPSILLYTYPIIVTSFLQLLFNAADLVIVGRFCGSISLAAVGATGSITGLIINLFIGLSVGCGVTVAHALGAEDNQETQKLIHTSIPAAIICGVFLTIFGITFSETFLRMMGTPENVLPLSTIYMQIYFAGMTFTMVFNFVASILRAAGDTRTPMLVLTLAGVVNVILNVLFVTVFDMNVAGVSLATTLSQAMSATLVVIALHKRHDACRLHLKRLRIYKAQLLKIMKIGIPAGIQSSLFAISNVMIQSSINSFGDVFMSGNAAAGNIEGFAYVSLNAFQQTAVNFTGQNVGAKQYDRIPKILKLCLGLACIVGLIVGGACYVFAPQLLSIYITDSAEAIAHGVMRMGLVCVPYFLCGMMEISTGVLRGLGASMTPMVMSVLGVCGVRIGWLSTIFQIPKFHTPFFLFISYPISWAFTFGIQMIALVYVYKKRLKQEGLLQTR